MTSEVYFGSVLHGARNQGAALARKLDLIIEQLDFSTIEKKEKVAIKMHLGFRDGYQTVPVFFVRRIVKAIRKQGAFPFITDNPTAVYNAVDRGYTQETCGCPLIPIAGVKDGYTKTTFIDFQNVDTLEMGGVLHDADVLVDLTHAKGHNSSGFGGAIKNIALGGYHGPSRWRKIHGVEQSIPYWDNEKCTPEHAKKLVKACPDNLISYDEEKHKLTLNFGMCNQCGECIKVDEGVGSLSLKPENFALFQELMARSANEVLKTFDKNKQFFITFAIDITALCDCWGFGQPVVINDIGVLGSRDIVAIEQATLDLIANEGLIENMIPPYIRNPILDPSIDLHPFARLHGPMKDPYIVTKYAEELGMGSREYKLIEVLSIEEAKRIDFKSQTFEDQPTFF